MAAWVSRQRADGGVTIQIKWRMDGRWQAESFTNARAAAEFRAAVEDAFLALMSFIEDFDDQHRHHGVQIENEIGLLGSSRDHSSHVEDTFRRSCRRPFVRAVVGHQSPSLRVDGLGRALASPTAPPRIARLGPR